MLVILPPSETKRPPPASGPTLDLDRLSFPELNPTRRMMLAALVEISGKPDAFERLRVRPTLVEEVLRNTVLDEVPTRPAAQVYAGPLYAGLDYDSLGAAARKRADGRLVIASALFGLLRPSDPIPAYRLHVCAHLPDMDIEPVWRRVLPETLAMAAGDGQDIVLDLRSSMFQATGKPAGMADRTIDLHVLPEPGQRAIGPVDAKRLRGEVARTIVESAADPAEPGELAALLGERWPVRLEPPDRPTKPWTLAIRPSD